MQLIIVSGRSGSGKSSTLHVLEDLGFYCIDNLPIILLPALVEKTHHEERLSKVAVSIDARNLAVSFNDIESILHDLPSAEYSLSVLYLDAQDDILLKRFSATRRKHPLTTNNVSLAEAIKQERDLLDPIVNMADLVLDTSNMSLHDMRRLIRVRVAEKYDNDTAILFESFGFKHGTPIDTDYVFDVRNLPNPYWIDDLRGFTGQQQPVIDFLSSYEVVKQMLSSITVFLEQWLPSFADAGRSYVTIAIGCTGGQHRSVYISEQLKAHFSQHFNNVQIRHRELPEQDNDPS